MAVMALGDGLRARRDADLDAKKYRRAGRRRPRDFVATTTTRCEPAQNLAREARRFTSATSACCRVMASARSIRFRMRSGEASDLARPRDGENGDPMPAIANAARASPTRSTACASRRYDVREILGPRPAHRAAHRRGRRCRDRRRDPAQDPPILQPRDPSVTDKGRFRAGALGGRPRAARTPRRGLLGARTTSRPAGRRGSYE